MNNPLQLICIIDDDPIYTFAVQKLLKMNNFSSHQIVFKNGKEALEGLTTLQNKNDQLPDVILLDINMPIMDGWEFLDAYKTKCFNKNNTMVTDYISKPLNNLSLEEIKQKCF